MAGLIDSKVLAVLDPHQVASIISPIPAIAGGHPVPGPQSPTVTDAMNKDCFVDDNSWRVILEYGEFDDIVVGSGALAYIDQAFKQNPFRKIVLLERGGFWLPDHFQNLPLPFQFVRYNVSETFPWQLTDETAKNDTWLNGSSPFFGGRSSFWSIWSPRAIGPNFDLMDGFPSFMKEIASHPDFYKRADELLHIKPANEIKDPIFDVLQGRFDHYLSDFNTWIGNPSLPPHHTMAACHVRGRASNNFQWHIQISGFHAPEESHAHFDQIDPGRAEKMAKFDEAVFASQSPDHGATLSASQWLDSEGHVVISCSTLGELPADTNSWVRHHKSNPDVTTNVLLNVDLPAKAKQVWDEMEQATFDAMKVIAAHEAANLEYWNYTTEKWEKVVPSREHVKRIKPLFHEASTLYMAEDLKKDLKASVNKTYRPYGLENGNVYVTGAGLFPTAGSWNPTPTICGYAQDLAKSLVTA